MKKIGFMLPLLILTISILGQEKNEIVLKTDVSEATVFLNGAQVIRKKSVELQSGKSTLRFSNLSPYIDSKSVQVKAVGQVMVLSVNHQLNFIDSLKHSDEIEKLLVKVKELDDKINIENANLETIAEEIAFLHENQKIGGSNLGINLTNLKETSAYYRDRISTLKLKELSIKKEINALNVEKNKIGNQIGRLNEFKPTPQGEIIVKVDAKSASKYDFELSYYVKNAGWNPGYDIRANNIEEPIQLIYKANIYQNTKEDWKNIKLKVSSANPNLGNVAPELKTYFLNYYTKPPKYDTNNQNNQISGRVVDQKTNDPIIGGSVKIKGSSIGTVTDPQGNFTLTIPNNASMIDISYIGYEKQTLPISASQMNIYLKESLNQLEEVAVIGYGARTKSQEDMLVGSTPGISIRGTNTLPVKTNSIPLPTNQIENQTNVEFEIKIPYTINSDNKNTTAEINRYDLAAEYEYFAIPKIDKTAFLLANIVDWEKYNLLEGEANIFFENTFVGKTILDVRYMSDTLSISLGRDKNVQVSREKIKEENKKQFLGSKKEESRTWKLIVKNNKKQTVNFVLLDQIPVSTMEEIEVIPESLSGGILEIENGKVKWKFELKSGNKKELDLKYKVKYPKDKSLTIE